MSSRMRRALQAIALAVAGCSVGCGAGKTQCEELVAASDWADAAPACLEAFRRSADPAQGVAAAKALLELGQVRRA
ncbi:MAG TPA: hypothetical protein PKU97_24680, partial [Kofleriaceae bacterium]|nr:hypothetical protein [Kofleriaceae bacterium]